MSATIRPSLGKPAPLLISAVWVGENPSGRWVSEKFDGVRGYWDGAALWSREGNRFNPPAWWTDKLPQGVALDGELWLGRGRYCETMGQMKRVSPQDDVWAQMRFCVFDAPSCPGTFEQRQSYIASVLLGRFDYSSAFHVEQRVCKGRAHMKKMLREIYALGGEGLMLRSPASHYERGPKPSRTLLKVRCENNTELLHD